MVYKFCAFILFHFKSAQIKDVNSNYLARLFQQSDQNLITTTILTRFNFNQIPTSNFNPNKQSQKLNYSVFICFSQKLRYMKRKSVQQVGKRDLKAIAICVK